MKFKKTIPIILISIFIIHINLYASGLDISRKLDLTNQELRWLHDNRNNTFVLAIEDIENELLYYNNQGVLDGFIISFKDYLDSIGLNLDLEIVSHADITNNDINYDGKIFLKNIEKKYFIYNNTSPIYEIPYACYISKEINVEKYDDLQNKIVGFISNDIVKYNLNHLHPNIRYAAKEYSSLEDLNNALLEEEIECYIAPKNYSDKVIEAFELYNISSQICIAVSKNEEIFYRILDKVIKYLDENDILKHLQQREKKNYYIQNIAFSLEEIQWIKKHNNINIAYNNSSKVFDKYIDNINNLLEQYFENIQVRFNIIDNYKQKQNDYLLSALEIGKIDVLGITTIENKNNKFLYTDYVMSNTLMVIGNKKSSYITTLKNLEGSRIACVKNSLLGDYLKRNLNDVTIIEVKNMLEVFKFVNSKFVDYAIQDMYSMNSYANEYNLNNLKVCGDVDITADSYFCTTNNNPELISILNKLMPIIEINDNEIYNIKIDNIKPNVDSKIIMFIIIIIILALIVPIIIKYTYKLNNEKKIRKRSEYEIIELKNKYEKIIHTIIETFEEANMIYDEETGEHIRRISKYAELIAAKYRAVIRYGIDAQYIKDIKNYASLHDIGKIGVNSKILRKPGKLTDEEFEEIKKHSNIGYTMLKKLNFSSIATNIARYHHERWDGKGYPLGLEGLNIPLEARIVAIVDVYDALRMKRVYKPAYSHEKAVSIIIQEKEKQFDPRLVDIFIQSEKEIELIYERENIK